jgi:tRNA (cytidine/uridine-2'-O-)-methyltransferase
MLNLVLVEPEIPPNTGNIARLCHATSTRLHLVEPLGFRLDEQSLRRAGMDYWHECDICQWKDWNTFLAGHPTARLHLFTTKATRSLWEAQFSDGDFLVFGRESRGLPESLLQSHPDSNLRIPMERRTRSLNLACSAGIGLYEALRQTGWKPAEFSGGSEKMAP